MTIEFTKLWQRGSRCWTLFFHNDDPIAQYHIDESNGFVTNDFAGDTLDSVEPFSIFKRTLE